MWALFAEKNKIYAKRMARLWSQKNWTDSSRNGEDNFSSLPPPFPSALVFLFNGSVETILFKICHFHRSSFFCEKYWKIFSPRTHFEWKHLTLTDAAVNFDWIRLSGLDKAVLSGHHGSSPGSGKGLYVKKGLEQNKRSDH